MSVTPIAISFLFHSNVRFFAGQLLSVIARCRQTRAIMALDTKQELTVTSAQAVVSPFSSAASPFKPYDQNLNSYLLPLFISCRSSGGEVDKISSKFILCDQVRNSHDPSVLQSIDIKRRNLTLITLRA